MEQVISFKLPLNVMAMGEEHCLPGHCFGPAVREYYLLHVVAEGTGVLQNAHGSFVVSAGQGFLILPGETTVYRADMEKPWHYLWAGFTGESIQATLSAFGLSSRKPIIDLNAQLDAIIRALRDLQTDATQLRMGELAAAGGVCRLLSLMGECAQVDGPGLSQAERYYRHALWLMESGSGGEAMSVQALAKGVGLSRSQLFRVFKQACGRPPQAVLNAWRMQQAVWLLEQTDLSIEQVAGAVGYSGAGCMCDAFRAAGMGKPSTYRGRKHLD